MLKQAALLLMFVFAPLTLHAQEVEVDQEKEAKAYVKEARKWKEWSLYNFNHAIEERTFKKPAKQRPVPIPPLWLKSYCLGNQRNMMTESQSLVQACTLLVQIEEITLGGPTILQFLSEVERREQSRPSSKFWNRLHVDALYVPSETGMGAAQGRGYLGFHYAPFQFGRLSVFGPPGILMVRQGRWILTATWGGSVRIGEFKFPGTDHLVEVHVDLIKVWMIGLSQVEKAGVYTPGRNMIGTSITFRDPYKKP
jgi:hypothetical protein